MVINVYVIWQSVFFLGREVILLMKLSISVKAKLLLTLLRLSIQLVTEGTLDLVI